MTRSAKTLTCLFLLLTAFLIIYLVYPDFSFDLAYLSKQATDCFTPGNNGAKRPEKIDLRCLNCNIILISLDTLRVDHLSFSGYHRKTSPNIDKLASKSIVFNNAYAPAFFTLPAQMSIFTSLNPLRHLVNSVNSPPLALEVKTLPEILKRTGFKTIWMGSLNYPHLKLNLGFGRGFDRFYPPLLDRRKGFRKGIFLDFIREVSGKRFFLFVHSLVNHDPYVFPAGPDRRYSDPSYSGNLPRNYKELIKKILISIKSEYLKDPSSFLQNFPAFKKFAEELENCFTSDNKLFSCSKIIENMNFENSNLAIFNPSVIYFGSIGNAPSPSDIRELKNQYDNSIRNVDGFVGSLIRELEQRDLMKNTILVLTSDHGEELYEHGGFMHLTFYDHTIHVPLIIHHPHLEGGVEIGSLVQTLDIMPTLLGWIGQRIPENISGTHLLPAEGEKDRRYIFGYSLGNMYVRSKKWKYILRKDGTRELYYPPLDPKEHRNLADKQSIFIKRHQKIMEIQLEKFTSR